MILFFYGPNTYLLNRKFLELKAKYLAASGDNFNLSTLDGENLTYNDFAAQTQAMPLLATSRLVVVENTQKNKNKDEVSAIIKSFKNISSTTNVVFVERGEPDKRTALFKALQSPPGGKSHYFKPLKPYELLKFIKQETESRGGGIDPAAAQTLAEFSLGDMWLVSNEIDKLINFARSRSIEVGDVELLSSKNIVSNTFALVDCLSQGKKKQAFEELEKFIATNEPPLKIFSLINFQFRAIAQIKTAVESGAKSQFEIMRKSSLAPFTVSKLKNLSEKFTWANLSRVYSAVAEIDEKIKTGRIEGNEGLKELILKV